MNDNPYDSTNQEETNDEIIDRLKRADPTPGDVPMTPVRSARGRALLEEIMSIKPTEYELAEPRTVTEDYPIQPMQPRALGGGYRRYLALAAAVLLVVVGGWSLAKVQRPDVTPINIGNSPATEIVTTATTATPATTATSTPLSNPAFRFETPTVTMTAVSVQVLANNRVFAPATSVEVRGDPGAIDSTTLELTWNERDIEQRIVVYFASDGINWWANEIRTYNGLPAGDWIEPTAQGEFFKSPLGTAFQGDLDLPNLKIRGMTIEAFRRASVCGSVSAVGSVALIADYPVIDTRPGGFVATMQVLDISTCKALPVATYTFEYISDDKTITTVAAEPSSDGDPATRARLSVQALAPGTTTIHATAKDANGNTVGVAEMRVIVR